MLRQRMIPTALFSILLACAALGTAQAQVGTWLLDGKVKARVKVEGKVGRDTQRFHGVLVINGDGTYTQPGTILCGSGDFFTAEVGNWRPVGRKRFVLQPSNVDALLGLIEQCFLGSLPVSVSATKYQHKVRVRRRGKRLVVKTIFRGYINVRDRSFPFRAAGLFTGTPVAHQSFRVTARQITLPGTLPPLGQKLSRRIEER